MHLPPQLKRACRGAVRMAGAASKRLSLRDLPDWWPLILAALAGAFAVSQASSSIASISRSDEAQDGRIAAVERDLNSMKVSVAKIETQTSTMVTGLDRIERKMDDRPPR